MNPRSPELDALLDRLLGRGPRDFERVMPIDARQEALTEQHVVPALPILEAEFLAIREELDRDMRGRLEANPAMAIRGDPSRYPKGYCLPITIQSFERFCARGIEVRGSEGFRAVWRFHEAGGVVARVWGILREQYFQNAMQLGSWYFDVANDTVDVRKPKIEHMPMAASGFRNVASLADFVRIAERYWRCSILPNLEFLRLAPFAPLLRIDHDEGMLSVIPLGEGMQWLSLEDRFREVEEYLCAGVREGRRLPEEWASRAAEHRQIHLPGAVLPPPGGFDEATIRRVCAEARATWCRPGQVPRALDQFRIAASRIRIRGPRSSGPETT